MEGSISSIPPYPQGSPHYREPGMQNKTQLINFFRKNPCIHLEQLFEKPIDPKTLFEVLTSPEFNGRVRVAIDGEEMPLTITESIIQEGPLVRTQINEPTYKEELLRHSGVKHYSLQLMDPHRPAPQGLLEAQEHLARMELINNKLGTGRSLDQADQQYLDERGIEEPEFEFFMAQSALESFKEIYNKPALSLRLAEDGSIGEIASIGSQSKQISGTMLMKWIDQFCKSLKVERLFLEDDAKIELPDVGSYNQRLYRYATGKNSWYSDSFSFQPYQYNCYLGKVVPSDADYRPEIANATKSIYQKTVAEALLLLSDPDYHLSKYPALKPLLEGLDANATIQSIIQKMGSEVISQHVPHHKELSLLLTGYLETLASYKGEDPSKILLKEQAEELLHSKFYMKMYAEIS